MKHILLIALNDLRLFLKEKTGYFWLFGSPVLFAVFMSFANRGPGGPSSPRPTVLIEDHDGGFLAHALQAELGSEGVNIITNDPKHQAERRLVIPEGFTRSILAKKPVELELARTEDSGQDAATMVELRLLRGLVGLNSRLLEQARDGVPPTDDSLAALRQKPNPVSLKSTFGTRTPIPAGPKQAVPGILVMFTMMNLLIFGGATLASERREGVLRRLVVQPLTPLELVSGKILGLMLLGGVQIAVLLAAGKFLLRMDYAGNLAAILLAMLVYAWMAGALGVLIGSLISQEDKIIAVCVLASMVMAALGGCWWPLEVVPDNVRLVGHLFPTAWAMDALHQLLSFGGTLANIGKPLAVLSLYALAASAAAVRWFRV